MMGIKGCYEKSITGSKHGVEQIKQNRGENSRGQAWGKMNTQNKNNQRKISKTTSMGNQGRRILEDSKLDHLLRSGTHAK
jgi:hypothetical protein